MALHAAELAKADRSHVVAALSRVRNTAPANWLGPNHLASHGELPNDWRVLVTVPAATLIEAVATSIPAHCVDGWSFAARAMNALMAGDAHGCRHMAYYAQLRAGLCIMANLGVGLFNGINFAVDITGQIVRIDPGPKSPKKGLGTHEIVWTALETWSQDANGSRAFLDHVKIRNVSLFDIIDTIWPNFISMTTVGDLIRVWGVDLKRGKQEKNFRNTSSYAPHALNALPMRTATNLRFLENSWRLFEPSATGSASFDRLDRYLLRRILLAQHDAMAPGTPVEGGEIANTYAQLPNVITSLCTREFLLGQVENAQPEIIRYADAKAIPANPLHMLARALLLLRTAMAFTHTSLTQAGIDTAAGELAPWLQDYSRGRGFCDISTALDGSELWDEVSLAVDDLKRSRTPAPADLMSWRKKSNNGMPIVTEAERIAVWSLCA